MPQTFAEAFGNCHTLPPLPPRPLSLCGKSHIVYDKYKLVSDNELYQWFSNIKIKYKNKNLRPIALIRQSEGGGINGDSNDWGAVRVNANKDLCKVLRSQDDQTTKFDKILKIITTLEEFSLQFLENKKMHLIDYYLLIQECNNNIKKSKL